LKSGYAYKADKGGTGKGECVIFRMPGEDMSFNDIIKGPLCKGVKDMADFVIVRSDGTPTFHMANVLDDIEMKITHIIRGDDHVENTFRHIALFRALGAAVPGYAHLPMIINQQGKPYSKRDGAAFVGEFREKGFMAEALFNYLTLLGWSPGDDREKLSRAELVDLFTLDRVKSGPAQMDLRKLTHLNALYISELPIEKFYEAARRVVVRMDWGVNYDETLFKGVCSLMQSRAHTFSAIEEWGYFFRDNITYDEKAVRKNLAKEGVKNLLSLIVERLAAADFSASSVEKLIRGVEVENGIGEGKLNQPVRVAITGTAVGAGIYETIVLLGRDRALSRINYAIGNLCNVQ